MWPFHKKRKDNFNCDFTIDEQFKILFYRDYNLYKEKTGKKYDVIDFNSCLTITERQFFDMINFEELMIFYNVEKNNMDGYWLQNINGNLYKIHYRERGEILRAKVYESTENIKKFYSKLLLSVTPKFFHLNPTW